MMDDGPFRSVAAILKIGQEWPTYGKSNKAIKYPRRDSIDGLK
jgi:hypothetical protein